MEDDQNGCAAFVEKLQDGFCLRCCVHEYSVNCDVLSATGQMERTNTLKLGASGRL